jgi:hypothetical protein
MVAKQTNQPNLFKICMTSRIRIRRRRRRSSVIKKGKSSAVAATAAREARSLLHNQLLFQLRIENEYTSLQREEETGAQKKKQTNWLELRNGFSTKRAERRNKDGREHGRSPNKMIEEEE